MTERPILFSGAMVRAILDGTKTQTRRVVKGRGSRGLPEFHGGRGEENDSSAWGWFFDGPDHHGYEVLARGLDERHDHGLVSMPCPFGRVGDRLWVRETWRTGAWRDDGRVALDYAASPEATRTPWLRPPAEVFRRLAKQGMDECHRAVRRGSLIEEHTDGRFTWPHGGSPCRWRPSIHMPRWASRITLEVTGVRVDRLNAISEEDALAEGVDVHMMPEEWRAVRQQHGRNEAITFDREPSADLIAALRLRDVTHAPARPMRSAVSGFSSLWESINGDGSWKANPWVWCVSFKVVTP